MPIKCRKCGFENPSTMDYCGSCGIAFDGSEKTSTPIKRRLSTGRTFFEDRGRISLLLYLGAALVALSALLNALVAAANIDNRVPPSYTAYALAILLIGFAFALVGFARQARRMSE